VLGDGGSGGGGDESGCCGDVEGSASISAGTAGIDEELAFGEGEGDRSDGGAHGVSETCDFRRGLSASCESPYKRGNFNVGELASEDLLEKIAGLFAAEGCATLDKVFQMWLWGHSYLKVAGVVRVLAALCSLSWGLTCPMDIVLCRLST
jgi:hypothetical protein